jgi:predicted amidohydrolase
MKDVSSPVRLARRCFFRMRSALAFVLDAWSRRVVVWAPAEASHDREETLIVECDPRQIEETRCNWPFLRDRRIDAYGRIINRAID